MAVTTTKTMNFVEMKYSTEQCILFWKNVLRLCIWFFLFDSLDAFNVEWRGATRYRGEDQTMFGFSIAQHKEKDKSWIVIGAPEAPDQSRGYPSDYRGGAVYYCNPNQNDTCSLIKSFTNYGSPYPNVAGSIDNRTRQWLGATVRSSGEDGIVLACAPRYFWFRSANNDKLARDPVGTCFTTKNQFQESEEYSPCRTKNNQGYSKQGSCQVGLGAAISKDSSRIYFGAVGSYYWQGQIFSIHTVLKLPFTFDEHEVLFNKETGQLISQSVFNRPDLMATKEGPSTEDDSYMGYSVESINFYETSISGAVVGVPRGDNLNGKVQLFTWNLTSVKNLTGEQFGSYFGYSVCVADVNGDGAEDIIVGAPMYSDYSTNKNDYEKGRIYIFFQTKKVCPVKDLACWNQKFESPVIIDGESSKSRFGLSLTSLGDINRDGFEDFAVGAPYYGTFGECVKSTVTGAVYIYHGSKDGVRYKYSQKITAEEISRQSQIPLTTFGFSLAGGVDMDNNLYPDLTVGAYESDTVYLFKSRPVINLLASLKFMSENKMIELDKYNCALKNRNLVQCITLQLCLQYNGIGVQEQIGLTVEISLDAKKIQSRMFFKHDEGNRNYVEIFHLQKGAGILCKDMVTYVPPLLPTEDKLTSLEAEMKYTLIDHFHDYPGALTPILNMDDETPLKRLDAIYIKNNCGKDNICIPELHMRVQPNVKQFVLGSGNLIFNVTVENKGEDSFGTVFKMRIPPGVHYSKFEDLSKGDLSSYMQCYSPKFDNNYTINCDIGNPLPKNRNVSLSITLHPKMEVEESEFDFWYSVNSSNAQMSAYTDTESYINIPIIEYTSLQIDMLSTPKEIYYNLSHFEDSKVETNVQAGPLLKHVYTIKNMGPSEVSEAIAVFYWPKKTPTGDDLLYLLHEPITTGNIVCQSIKDDVNPKFLKVVYEMNEENEKDKRTSYSSGTTGIVQESQPSYSKSTNKNTNNYGSSTNYINEGNNDKYYYGKKGYEQEKTSGSKITSNDSYFYGSQSGQKGYPDIESVSQGGQINVHAGGSFHGSQTDIYSGNSYQNQNNYDNKGSYHGSQTNFHNSDKTNIQSGKSNQGSQTNFHSEGSYQGQTNYQAGGSFQKGQSTFDNTYQSGGGSYSGGFLPDNTLQNNYNQFLGTKNFSSVHESQSSYTKNTKWNENGPLTFIDSKWRTNDNGVIQNGSFSTIKPGYDDNYFFEKNTNQHFGGGVASGSSHTFDINSGTVIDGPLIGADGSVITTIDGGIQRIIPEIKRKGNESESVYHIRSENTQFMRSRILPNGSILYSPPMEWRSNNNQKMLHNINDEKLKRFTESVRQSNRDNDEYDADEGEYDEMNADDEEDNDYVDKKPNKNHRSKRHVIDESESSKDFCSLYICATLVCNIRHLAKEQEVSVTLKSLVWINTIKKIAVNRPVELGSFVEVNVTKLPHIRSPKLNTTYTAEMLTNVTSLDFGKTPPDVIPLWIIVISACLGALILMLLVYLLYKSGFFKRNRPPTLPERQPLNRNGNYHLGDEAL